MQLSTEWKIIGVQIFRYSEKPPLYYVCTIKARKYEGIVALYRAKQFPPVTDVKEVTKTCKALARRLRVPYVVGLQNESTSIKLEVLKGKVTEYVVCK